MATARLQGFAGFALINGVQVLMTSGGFNTTNAVSYLEPLDLAPPDTSGPTYYSRSRIVHASGTAAYGGNISFDLTEEFLDTITLSNLVRRGYQFDVKISDGVNTPRLMEDCYWTSLEISGAANGLISCNMSFVSANADATDAGGGDYYRDDYPPLGYWYSGNSSAGVEVRDWNLVMQQPVTPVYTNKADVMSVAQVAPTYMRVGLWTFALNVTTYDELEPLAAIAIKGVNFTITGNTISSGYSFNGTTDLGTFSHSFESGAAATSGSSGTIIAIT